ncbi:putative disease resistance protein RGA3 [Nymphaea colorata]|uniref:NB-ARC domain-containing protein n=1 Tax=Nymphaea colorata TaxID=210225 RepID=A0A5K0V077_9MAGN|nr:putative disease resistance protein RGA3 [Nymphaea colorata]
MAGVIGALAETAISNLLGAVTNLLKEKRDVILNANDDLKKLQRKLKIFQKAITDADRKPFLSKERDRDLEGDLKDVVYDAEDIIEEYQSKIEVSKKVHKRPWTALFHSVNEHVSFPCQLGNEIKEINERLDEIKKDWDMDLLKPKPKESSQGLIGGEVDNFRETTHHIGAQPPIGRENDKRVIVEKLLSIGSEQSSMTEECDVSIISIVGEGGIGKTTLAKMVFSEVKQQFGGCRWWVCVSERPNRKDLLRKILKEVCKESKAGLDTSLNDLCTQIQSELWNKRFLLVLDDVWELDWWQGEVESTLTRGAMGSKILITSRNIDVSKGVGALYMHRLPILQEDESWNLFLNKALMSKNDLVSHNLHDIAKKIVKKCSGLPLVVQTVGSLMRTKSMEKAEWKVVADSVIWEWKMPASSSSSQYGSILPGLILSYDDLPPYLGSCFVYCSIFPKDHEIEREGLIMQWVAHGLIEEKEGIGLEVTANQYIEDLIKRCLIETHDRFYRGTCLKLHDVLHDLASYIGGKEYRHASDTSQTRHLSLLGVDDAEAAMQYNASGAANKVRTLLSASLSSVEFTNFKWLRVLSLMQCQMDELPNSIESLSLLKYLDLSRSDMRRLPRSIGKLCNLQTLDLSYSKIEELPEEMGELCHLRYLGLEVTVHLKFMAEGLGKLTNLWTLHRFLVCDDKGDTRGCNIGELKDLNKLKGELLIEGLGGRRVKVIDAKKAQLKEKRELNGVELNFKVGKDDKVDSASEQRGLLEALEPPHGIERLGICDYEGDRPAWYLDTNYEELRTLRLRRCRLLATVVGIKSLEKLEVSYCPKLYELRCLPLLKSLSMFSCDGLNTIADMPALKSLKVPPSNRLKTLANMPALESLEVDECRSLEQVAEMPTLISLEVVRCSRLKTLANMPALESSDVRYCGSLEQVAEMPALRSLRVEGCNMLKTLANMPALESSDVRYCGSLEQVAEMPALRSLRVYGCNMLKTLANMLALESLEVRDCGSLEQVAEMPALSSLEVGRCKRLKTLAHMPALQSLHVSHCGRLEQLADDHMPALKSLEVTYCGSLEQLPHDMPALKSLEVRYCCCLEQVAEMPVLKSLKIDGCDGLNALAHMPTMELLDVRDCNRLEQVVVDHMPDLKKLRLSDVNTPKHLPTCLPSLEILTMENLANWEGWPAAGSGDTIFTSMPFLREACFENCPKMQTEGLLYCLLELAGHEGQATQLQELGVWDCPNARLGWKLLQHLPTLIDLKLDGAALESIVVPSEVSTILPSLKRLSLKDNNTGDLKWGQVPDWVWGLSQLEKLTLYGFTENISLGGHWQCLPKLRRLWLFEFPNLKSLVAINDINPQQNETTCPMDAKQQIACLSELQHLLIYSCPALDLPQELRDRLGKRLERR